MAVPPATRCLRSWSFIVGCVLASAVAVAAPPAERPISYARDIQPIFAKHCYACHGPQAAEGGLRLHMATYALAATDAGDAALVPKDADASRLVARISASAVDERMPPEGDPLSDRQIDLIRRWIERGAEFQAHWAFEPITQPVIPSVDQPRWSRNPIDRFVLGQLESHGLQPSPPADPAVLIRRATFDLTGLPPTPAQVEQFVADASPAAYGRLVERLLASPRYGEKWGRHWLDLVRFAETNSFERDNPKPFAWRYRDYVIRSLNADKPFDQFLREQLAGDEMYPAGTAGQAASDALIATGYLRLGLWDDEPSDRLQHRYDCLDDIVKTTAQVMLGLTLDCARCHDHKIDPLPQTDYYRMVAFFENITDMQTRGANIERPFFLVEEDRAEYEQAMAERQREIAERRAQVATLEAALRACVAGGPARASGDARARIEALLREYGPDAFDPDLLESFRGAEQEYQDCKNAWFEWRDTALCVTEYDHEPAESYVRLRGNPHLRGPDVVPGFPDILGGGDADLAKAPQREGSRGRRSLLANWMVQPDNRLTARVIANRVWQYHFGRGIVRTPNNFGLGGDPPTHPQLLDWLARQLMRDGWRLKSLHRSIMLSQTYQMSSAATADGLAIDPSNDWFWRFDMRRLTAEEMRDAMLAVSGQLNLKMGGPGFYEKIPQVVLNGQSRPGDGWGESSDVERARRSIYIHVKRSLLTPLLVSFDLAEPDASCPVRFATTQPTQALGSLNSDAFQELAAAFAARLRRECPDDVRAQVARALRLAVLRWPTSAEIERGVQLIEELQSKQGVDSDQALQLYCLVVLNLNEFIYLD